MREEPVHIPCGIGWACGRQWDDLPPGAREKKFAVNLCGGCTVCIDLPDRCAVQNKLNFHRHSIFDAAVTGADNITGIDAVPQSNVVCEHQCPLFLRCLWERCLQQACHQRPEAVLRMAVVKIHLAGFCGRKTAKDEDTRRRIKNRPELTRNMPVFPCHAYSAVSSAEAETALMCSNSLGVKM